MFQVNEKLNACGIHFHRATKQFRDKKWLGEKKKQSLEEKRFIRDSAVHIFSCVLVEILHF